MASIDYQEKARMLIRDTFSEEDYPAKFQGRSLVGIISDVTQPRGPSPCEASKEPPHLSLDGDTMTIRYKDSNYEYKYQHQHQYEYQHQHQYEYRPSCYEQDEKEEEESPKCRKCGVEGGYEDCCSGGDWMMYEDGTWACFECSEE